MIEIARSLRSTMSPEEVRVLLAVFANSIPDDRDAPLVRTLRSLAALRLVEINNGEPEITELGRLAVFAGAQ